MDTAMQAELEARCAKANDIRQRVNRWKKWIGDVRQATKINLSFMDSRNDREERKPVDLTMWGETTDFHAIALAASLEALGKMVTEQIDALEAEYAAL